MATQLISGALFADMIRGGAANLAPNRQIVNDLNVFPIPDGDTGDNMYMTIDAGASELRTDGGADLGEVAAQAAKGMLLGARGNSGVILSRIFAGISHGLSGVTEADLPTFAGAFARGVEEAYRAVSVPVEGTILTVYKDAVRYAADRLTPQSTAEDFFEDFTYELHSSLERTPELLDVLKQAGVVDSGGAGFIYIAEGMRGALDGPAAYASAAPTARKAGPDLDLFTEDSALAFGYCTEFLLRLQRSKVDLDRFDVKEISDWLNAAGESVVCFRDGSIVKVHVHTKTPGEILNHMQKYGEFLTLKIENMTIQHNQSIVQNNYSSPDNRSEDDLVLRTDKPKKKYATVTVAAGEGVCNLFREIGVDAVINGGQSMNPSVRDFRDAFDTIEAENIIVFPNNGNVILTARQIAEVYDKANIIVIPNKDLGTGYAAISVLDTSKETTEELLASIYKSMQGVVTAAVSKANRDTEQDGVAIRSGDYIGFVGDTIFTDSPNRAESCEKLLSHLNSGDYSILMLIKGKDVPQQEADALAMELEEKYKLTEIIPIDGGQPIHDYVIILEE